MNLDPALACIKPLLSYPPPHDTARDQALQRQAELIKPSGSLGRLEEIIAWMAAWQGSSQPRCTHVRILLCAGHHGIAIKHGISAFPTSTTTLMVKAFETGQAAINQLARFVGAEIEIVAFDSERPSGDIVETLALDPQECAQAILRGAEAVHDRIDLLCIGEMGIGNSGVAAALACALYKGDVADWVGPGTGLQGQALERKRQLIASAIQRYRRADPGADPGPDPSPDPGHNGLSILCHLGGYEFAAMLGAVLAARSKRIPVLLDGFACTAAAALAPALIPHHGPHHGQSYEAKVAEALGHVRLGHLSAEPAHYRLARTLGLAPLLNLDMRLGEATGAALAVAIVRGALACHSGMATRSEIGIDEITKDD